MPFLFNLRDFLLDCPIKKNLGINCLGCGFQRSMVLLLEGNILESIKMYPATIPILVTWSLLFLHLIFKFKNGANWIKYSFIFSAFLIVVNYIVKLI